MIGETLGGYRLVSQIGEGGMGVVYRAEHLTLGSPAAVKMLLPHLSADQSIVARFFNEAKAAAGIQHPGLITVFDFGYHDSGSAYIILEFLQGEPLSEKIAKEAPLSAEFVGDYFRQVGSALSAAHDAGIVHRDLKPDNLFLCPDPATSLGVRAKILDFGIAKLSGDTQGASVKTRTGAVMGTPAYMAPEQCRGAGGVDTRADIYALGCIAFEMVTRRPPFEGMGVGEVLGKQQFHEPPKVQSLAPSLPNEFAALIDQCLEKDPADRPQRADELGVALAEASRGAGQPARASTGPITAKKSATTLGGAVAAGTVPSGEARGRRYLAPVLVLGAAAAAALGYFVMAGRGNTDAEPPKVSAAAKLDAGNVVTPVDEVPLGEAELALALLIDGSGSMEGVRLESAKEAVRAAAMTLAPSDLIAITGFDSQPNNALVLQRANDPAKISSGIDALTAKGGTNILSGLQEVRVSLAHADAKRKHVILLTDGAAAPAGIEELVREMRAAQITVSAVGIAEADQGLLQRIAGAGSGRLHMVNDKGNLATSLAEVFAGEAKQARKPADAVASTETLPLPPGAEIGGKRHPAFRPAGEKDPTTTPDAPKTFKLTIRTAPKGAKVLRMPGKKVMGKTPLDLTLSAKDKEHTFLVRRRGYLDKTVRVDGVEDQVKNIILEKRERIPTRPEGRAIDPFSNRRPINL